MDLVELVHEVELAALFARGDVAIADVLDHLLHGCGGGVDGGALKRAGQKGGAVIAGAAGGEFAAA